MPAARQSPEKRSSRRSTTVSGGRSRGPRAKLLDLVPDPVRVAFLQEHRPDKEGHESNDDRISQSRGNIAGACDDPGGDEREESSEPAISEVVRKRQRRIADLRGECLHEKRCDGTVYHRD